jgi:hypothetical protein
VSGTIANEFARSDPEGFDPEGFERAATLRTASNSVVGSGLVANGFERTVVATSSSRGLRRDRRQG